MFMRAVLSEEARVGLLLFDEPSAALDPTAEHGAHTSIVFTPLRAGIASLSINQICSHGFESLGERKR